MQEALQTAKDRYSLNDVQAKQAHQAERMLEATNASLERSREFNEETVRREKIAKRIIELVSDDPGGYTEAELVRVLQRQESIETAEAVMAVHGAFMQNIILFHRKDNEHLIYLRMDLPQ